MFRLNAKLLVFLLMAAVLFISAAHPGMAASKIYTIQVSSHKTASEAAQKVTDLESMGLEAGVSRESLANRGVWHRVYVGRFWTNTEASQEARRLKSGGAINDYWVKPIPESAIEEKRVTVGSDSDETDWKIAGIDRNPGILESAAAELTGGGSSSRDCVKPEVIRFGQPREASLGGFSPYGPNQYESGPFYLGLRMGVESWLNAGEFVVTRTRGALTEYWRINSDRAGFITFAPAYRINEYFTVEGGIERTWAGTIESWSGAMGFKAGIPLPGNFYPYIKGSGILSTFVWEAVPGSFDSDIGYEAACGFDIHMNRLKLGFELGYRSIQFAYRAPSNEGVIGGDQEIDLSAVRFSTSVSYAF